MQITICTAEQAKKRQIFHNTRPRYVRHKPSPNPQHRFRPGRYRALTLLSYGHDDAQFMQQGSQQLVRPCRLFGKFAQDAVFNLLAQKPGT